MRITVTYMILHEGLHTSRRRESRSFWLDSGFLDRAKKINDEYEQSGINNRHLSSA